MVRYLPSALIILGLLFMAIGFYLRPKGVPAKWGDVFGFWQESTTVGKALYLVGWSALIVGVFLLLRRQ
jgi:hypothetical protein